MSSTAARGADGPPRTGTPPVGRGQRPARPLCTRDHHHSAAGAHAAAQRPDCATHGVLPRLRSLESDVRLLGGPADGAEMATSSRRAGRDHRRAPTARQRIRPDAIDKRGGKIAQSGRCAARERDRGLSRRPEDQAPRRVHIQLEGKSTCCSGSCLRACTWSPFSRSVSRRFARGTPSCSGWDHFPLLWIIGALMQPTAKAVAADTRLAQS